MNEFELLKEAKELANNKRCFVAKKGEDFLLFRKTATKNVFIGKRSSIPDLLKLVKKS